jgi:hypothetical protein
MPLSGGQQKMPDLVGLAWRFHSHGFGRLIEPAGVIAGFSIELIASEDFTSGAYQRIAAIELQTKPGHEAVFGQGIEP